MLRHCVGWIKSIGEDPVDASSSPEPRARCRPVQVGARSRGRAPARRHESNFALHDSEGLHLDQAFKFRDRNSSKAIDPQEIDANRFAAELLMPEDEVLGAVAADELDLNDDQAVRRLAKHFGVSQQALMIRLGTLRVYVDGAANI